MPDTLVLPKRLPGSRWFKDIDGYASVAKDRDSIESFTLDWSSELGSDTISSVTVEENGVTSSDSNTTTTTTHVVTGSDGRLVVKAVTAGGETLVQRLRFISTDRRKTADYGIY